MKIFQAIIAPAVTAAVAVLSSCSVQPLLISSDQNGRATVNYDRKPLNSQTLPPNGIQTHEWVIHLLDSDNKPLAGVPVSFSVEAVFPLKGWRTVEEVAPRYGSSAALLRQRVNNGQIRLLGSVSPARAVTDEQGNASTIYTVSHIGSNEEQSGQEKIIARAGEQTFNTLVNTGYTDLVPIPLVEGGLRISGASGRYVQQSVGKLLENLGQALKTENWPQPLTITAGTLRWGGLYPPHFTHRRGGTFDFRPMSADGNPTWCNTDGSHADNYDRSRTLALIKVFFESGAREILFNDPQAAALGAKPLAGHHNHLHVSWLDDKEKDIISNKIRSDLKINLKTFSEK